MYTKSFSHKGVFKLTSTPFASTTLSARIKAAPALALDAEQQVLDMTELSASHLIEEAVAVNHASITKDKTLDRYRDHLDHFASYLASAQKVTPTTARRKHVLMFLNHLSKQGGSSPDALRTDCEWCKGRGYPDGRDGCGWSASYRKSYLSAIRFLYYHCLNEEDLPNEDPSARIPCPKVIIEARYTPTRDEVKQFLAAEGRARDQLLAHWVFYAPSRRATFAAARWRDIDLENGRWIIPHGKGDKEDSFVLHPLLRAEFRRYLKWQLKQAERNPAIYAALQDPETSYVLLTRTGKPMRAETIAKVIQWRAIRAGVAVIDAPGRKDCPGGKTTRLTPHSLRRAWATIAHNEWGYDLETVSEVLNHADISTTRKHYIQSKPERANNALLGMRL